MPLSPGTCLGPYEIVAAIGAGGMGEVYKARDTRLGRDVAIKVSQGKFSERFEREARSIAALNHPHICTLYDVGPNYLVMEYIEGTPLQGPLPLDQALKYAAQICDALDAAHKKGITHRDLKPANILVTKSGIKLLDFGLAKSEPFTSAAEGPLANTVSMAITGKHEIVGTLAYMSPEHLQAASTGREVDARSDIFSFGIVLYEMLTGKQAFEGPSAASVIAGIMERPAPSVTELAPRTLDRVLQRCLAKDADDRWQTARDLRAELTWIAEEPRQAGAQPLKSSAQRRWLWFAAAASLAVLAAAWSFTQFRKPPARLEEWRFQIPLPDDLRFSAYGSFALSPDSGRLAYFAQNRDGVFHLWIRSQSSLEARQVPGTDLVGDTRAGVPQPPFWSPDSRFIAYGFQGKLTKVDVASGGPPQVVCAIPDAAVGGSWNTAGVMLLGNNLGGLLSVSANSESPATVTLPDSNRRAGTGSFPQFLPDGKHFVYFRAARDRTGIYVGSLDTKPQEQPRNRLLASDTNAVFVPAPNSAVGELLFLRQGRLLAQRFDSDRRELVGEPVAVAEQVGRFASYGYFAASANVLVFRVANLNSQLKWFDREGKVLGAAGEPAVFEPGIALAPDGSRVAVSRQGDIWVYEFSRGVSTRLTLGLGFGRNPVWSPDGARIAFSSFRGSAGTLYQTYSNGTGQNEVLLQSDQAKFPTSWSPDGHLILYTQGANEDRSLWMLSLSGAPGQQKPVPLVQTAAVAEKGFFSPNNRWVAYVSAESGRSEVYVQTVEAGSSSSRGKWIVSKGGGTNPRWRRDGKELFYLAPDGKVMAVDVAGAGAFQPAAPHPLFQGPLFSPTSGGNDSTPSWDVGADGKRFLFLVPDLDNSHVPFTVRLNWRTAVQGVRSGLSGAQKD